MIAMAEISDPHPPGGKVIDIPLLLNLLPFQIVNAARDIWGSPSFFYSQDELAHCFLLFLFSSIRARNAEFKHFPKWYSQLRYIKSLFHSFW